MKSLRGIAPARRAPVYPDDPKYEEARDEQGLCYRYSGGEGQPPYDPEHDTVNTGLGYAR